MATELGGVVSLAIWVRTVWFTVTDWLRTVPAAWLAFTGVVLVAKRADIGNREAEEWGRDVARTTLNISTSCVALPPTRKESWQGAEHLA